MTDRPAELLGMLASMVRIRRVEERLSELFTQGKIPGFIHVSIGQEAVPAGVCACLDREDAVLTTHRGHGHAVAKGIDLKRFMAEIFGRRTGFCKGRSGSMHVADPAVGVMGANGIVVGGLPISLGTAFASQYRGEKAVTVCFFGDGASNEGTFHESLMLADDVLTVGGKVLKKYVSDGKGLVELELWIKNESGANCVPGKGLVAVPLRARS